MYKIIYSHQTKNCPHCGKDTYMTYFEIGKCPHCNGDIKIGNPKKH